MHQIVLCTCCSANREAFEGIVQCDAANIMLSSSWSTGFQDGVALTDLLEKFSNGQMLTSFRGC